MKKVDEMDRDELLYTLLAQKVGAVDPQSIFYAKLIERGENAGKYSCLIGGKRLTPNQAKNLQAEAKMLEAMQVWTLFTNTLRHEAQMRMFERSKTTEDMFFGKAILHAVGVFETILESIKQAQIDAPAKQLSPTPNRSG